MTPDANMKAFPAQVTDRHFIIDPAHHTVAAQTMSLNLARFSDGADRFVFTISGVAVDGHSLAGCNSAMIHFENIGEDPEQRSAGIYPIEDLVVGAESATCSWLIRKEATAYTGALLFSIHFVRIADDGTEEYRLPTLAYSRVTVGPTVWASETIAIEHPDIIAQFDARLKKLEQMPGGGGGGVAFDTDYTLKLENGILSVNTTDKMEQDNTLPITSAGVFATVGNIEALLKTI